MAKLQRYIKTDSPFLSLVPLLEDVRQPTPATVLTIIVHSHKDTSTASVVGALPPQTSDFAIIVDLVVLQDGQFDLLALVLDLFGGGVGLLLALFATTAETEDEVEGGFFLDVVVCFWEEGQRLCKRRS